VNRRILFGVAAWLLGAATATAGSLLAVSLLGQGITGGSGPLLTQDAVNRALASESSEPSEPSESSAAARPSAGRPPASPGQEPAAAKTAAAPSQTHVPAPPSPSPSSAGGPAPVGTLLTSRGGDVVASCLATGTYLDSWSPSQGYNVDEVSRGPAGTARVTFDSDAVSVTVVVSCSAGVPSATSYTREGDD
jgi:serine/threonine-protein kinase